MRILFNIIFFIILFYSKANANTYPYSQVYIYENQDYEVETENLETNDVLIEDPFEIINRNIFNINYLIDRAFISPVTKLYLKIPSRERSYVSNFISNIGEPVNAVNLLLQGEFKQSHTSITRFITNSLLGFFGIMDVATELKLKYVSEDFGQTLAHYGVGSGPYIVAPLIGPLSTRDLSGKVSDYYMNPFVYTLDRKEITSIGAVGFLNKRAGVDGVIRIINNSLDPYETTKLLYIQNRNSQIKKNN